MACNSTHHPKGLDGFVVNDHRLWWKSLSRQISPNLLIHHVEIQGVGRMCDGM